MTAARRLSYLFASRPRTRETTGSPKYRSFERQHPTAAVECLLPGDILDSNHQTASVDLLGETVHGDEIVGTIEVDLSISGKALRNLLDELALTGVL